MDPEIYKIAATLTPKERLEFLDSEMEFDRWANGPTGEMPGVDSISLDESPNRFATRNGRPSKVPWMAVIVGGFALLVLGWAGWTVAANFGFSLTLPHI